MHILSGDLSSSMYSGTIRAKTDLEIIFRCSNEAM